MNRHRGFALLGGLIGVVALVCAAIFGGFGLLATGSDTGAGADSANGTAATSGTGTGGARGQNPPPGRAAPASADAWTGTWATAPAGVETGMPYGHPGRSIRNVVHTSIGGTSARVTLSNLYSPRPLVIGHASVAVGAGGPRAVDGTLRQLSFNGRAAVTVPAGGQIISDPVALRVPYDGDLLVTLFTPVAGGPVTYHPSALQTSYLADGDRTQDSSGAAYTEPSKVWRYLTAVDVQNRESRGAVVAFGDSITDGVGSRTDANSRWPDILADRLSGRHIGVLNEGIGGNTVLQDSVQDRKGASGISRFQRDVLDRAGVRTVVIDLGVNDILRGQERDPGRITAGLRELTRQAHARGLRVIGSTLTPFGGHRGYTAENESVRERVNAEIRAGGVFDDVVDFDRVVRDPYAPHRIRPLYDAGDGLHPSDAGYRAMGRALDLELLETKAPAAL
ncbi:GDSL-type esterase/lipase family protein [Streptomyces sp. JV176]|uniref:GDSL-type esterase/lipase family protein n=1 Tax=Streptomyces sp. JV176 TaxID=858630 RepID=UPI002E768F2C|nr:GDSL-type esterase/lipase family protein [Streptomyces sp. JV176]MEE1802390.1 GDSL-type esterase/lipase family protein [Streptomyces sp. JV176]